VIYGLAAVAGQPSELELAVSSTGILERIKNFTIPKSFI
jgi:hypothetical protein